jgi:threonine/homoserine/homoserine lactone efflux protein
VALFIKKVRCIPIGCLILVILSLLVVLSLATRVDKLTENVYTIKLVGGCYLDYHVVDYMRLWPWPVRQPWSDPTDWPEPSQGWYVEILDPASLGGVFAY